MLSHCLKTDFDYRYQYVLCTYITYNIYNTHYYKIKT